MSISKEFKEFATKGSVVDLAVGVIIGSGWDIAPNVSAEFRRIAIGSLSYEDLPKVIRCFYQIFRTEELHLFFINYYL